jgi:hypothetical protein
MNRLLLASVAALGCVLLPGTARAQYNGINYGGYGGNGPFGSIGGYGRPGYYNPALSPARLSPYLDIVGRGTNPAVNYYLGTRSEIDRRATQAIYGQAINTLQREVRGDEVAIEDFGELPESGHGVMFNNTWGYFPTGTPLRYGMGPTGRAPTASKGGKKTN